MIGPTARLLRLMALGLGVAALPALVAGLALLTACDTPAPSDPIDAAVANPDRPATDRDRDLNRKPAEAMRSAPPPVGGAVFIERWRLFWRRLDAQWQMILRGMLRNNSRTLVAVFAAAMGSGGV